MADDNASLPYDRWIEDALRGVVRRALEHTASHGLTGGHHFYISFLTAAGGVDLPAHLRARYPDEMTIVLQHQFWDLEVEDEAFSVGLKFGGRFQPLRVPFRAITAFGDPSVNFGLRFKVAEPTHARTDTAPAERQEAGDSEPKRAGTDAGEVIAIDAFRKK